MDSPLLIVLVIDDDPIVARAIARVLASAFDEVLIASSPAEAERHLAASAVTHLVCDFHLGQEHQGGVALVSKWRRKFPSIQRAIICSGSERTQIVLTEEVDALVTKPAHERDLLRALQGTAPA